MNKTQALKILSAPSKMPGYTYNLHPESCKTGSKLRAIPGSVCADCYACKGNYCFPVVQNAMRRRVQEIQAKQWEHNIIAAIRTTKTVWFRWHDAGDLQSVEHLAKIVRIARTMPEVNFWLPTKEYGFVRQYLGTIEHWLPYNLTIRLSAHMQDNYKTPAKYGKRWNFPISIVENKLQFSEAFQCPAPNQNGKCADCRACWDKNVFCVAYQKH